MIVSVNQIVDNLSTADKYKQLFAKAYQALEANHITPKVEYADKAFHTLDEYFAHLADLYTIDPVYILLPLDETTFDINANKRTISNPNIVILQNDQNAEIVMFTIDRYFDFKDLSTAEIYVQWTLPDETEGATKIEVVDMTTIPGKLRFGWPLDKAVTAQKGKVKFSVRFWNRDKMKNESGEMVDTVVYSLNTLTSTLTISESLQPELTEDTLVDTPLNDGFFKKAIINSNILTENNAIPLNPHFSEPGLNLNAYESLTDDTLTLKAQAVTSDCGELSYAWYYKPASITTDGDLAEFTSTDTWYPYESEQVESGTDGMLVTLPGFKKYGGKVSEEYVEVVGDPISGENYYMKSGSSYVAYDGTPNITLYERYTTYTVPSAPTAVTGQYKVVATNTLGINKSSSVSSKVCQLISPSEIKFATNGDLDESAILTIDGTIPLTINLQSSDVAVDKRTVIWYGSTFTDIPEDFTSLTSMSELNKNETKVAYDVTKPGWYQARVFASLNRQNKEKASTVCKVTYAPQAPSTESQAIIKMSYDKDYATEWGVSNGLPHKSVDVGNTVDFGIKVEVTPPDGVSEKLYSEGLSYEWWCQKTDKEWTKIGPDDGIITEGYGTNHITITMTEGIDNGCVFGCRVINVLNGRTAASELKDALKFSFF